MHRVASSGNNSIRSRKEKRLSYVLNDANNTKHCAGVNCLAVLKSSDANRSDYLFTGSRDGTVKRWELSDDDATCSATFEAHVDWVNDAVLVGRDTLVSCSSDTTLKVWNCFSDGACARILRQHTDYVTCLAAANENSNIVASGGLGGEVFIWDLEAALPSTRSSDAGEDKSPNCVNGSISTVAFNGLRNTGSSNSITVHSPQSHAFVPVAAKGHKESVYALSMNDSGTVLVSGGTEKVIRVWDPRSGSKTLKLRGHTDNIRALLLDPSGRFCLSGSSDSMIRLWDLGQQRCVHSYAVHTDSVWALASTPTFSHVYSGGRDLSLYLTDLATRESTLLCANDHPISQLELHDDGIWVATSDSSVHKWPVEGCNPQKVLQNGGSFLAGNLSFSRARASLEGSALIPAFKKPSITIPGAPGIVKHEILNDRRHVLSKDAAGSVKLWEVTRGIVVADYGEVSFEDKKEELFEMVSVPAWFTVDARLGSLSIHLDTPQCFSAEMYSADLNIVENAEDDKVNLGRETLKGLLAHWLGKRRHKFASQHLSNGEVSSSKDMSTRNFSLSSSKEMDGSVGNDFVVYPPFEFSTYSPPSIIAEGGQDGPWRKKITDLDGNEDEKKFPSWCLDCVLDNRLPPRENAKHGNGWKLQEGILGKTIEHFAVLRKSVARIWKQAYHDISNGRVVNVSSKMRCRVGRKRILVDLNKIFEIPLSSRTNIISLAAATHTNVIKPLLTEENKKERCGFYLQPCEGSPVPILTQGKLSAPRILRIHKVMNYVIDKIVSDKPSDGSDADGSFISGQSIAVEGEDSFKPGSRHSQKLNPSVDILCNDQVLSPEMSLATVRAYIWKKQEELVLTYRLAQGK